MSETQGKAIFDKKGSNLPSTRNWSGSQDNDLVSIDYPTHALFIEGDDWLRQDSAPIIYGSSKPIFEEWMLGSTSWNNPDQWTEEILKDARKNLETGKLGVFSPTFNRLDKTTSGNGDGFSVTRWLGNHPFPDAFGKDNWQEGYRRLLRNLTHLPRKSGYYSDSTDIDTGAGNDIVLTGWLGNGKVKTSAGDDIILSSPQVFAATLYDSRYENRTFRSDRYWANQYAYYPAAYASKSRKDYPNPFNKKGNIYDTGSGNDLIYYDGGTDKAFGGADNDIFAPSFGSFNWAIDTLVQDSRGSRTNALGFIPGIYEKNKDQYHPSFELGEIRYKLRGDKVVSELYAPFTGHKALVSPLTIFSRDQEVPTNKTLGKDYRAYGYALQFQATLTGGNNRVFSDIEESTFLPAQNSGLKQRPAGTGQSAIVIDDNNINILGGQSLFGGPGNDLFYGIDPGFYQGFESAGNGRGLRLAFNRGKGATGREHAQIVDPVLMFGGLGSDYFSLGNPANLAPADRVIGGDWTYRISGNHDEFLNRSTQSFGDQASADVFEFTATYQGDNWERTTVSVPGSEGNTNTAQDYANLGFTAMSAVQGLADAIGKQMPIWGAIAGVGSFITSLTGLFQPKPKDPISQTDTYFRDPLGAWSTKTNIQDWDPSDAIVIRVDPADPKSASNERWERVNFSLASTSDSSDKNALDINYRWGNETPKPIVRLENFNDTTSQGKGAWFAWNFNEGNREGERVQIDKSHLSFFGQVPIGQKSIDLPSYKDEFGFQVKAGDVVFRWTDAELRNQDRLADLRTSSESIVLQLDTRSLGYFWEPVYKGTAKPSSSDSNPMIQDLELDPEESKLWIKQNSQSSRDKQWISYSFDDISKNPKAKQAALRATPIWDTSNLSGTGLDHETDRIQIDAREAIGVIIDGMSILEQEINDDLNSLTLDPLTGKELEIRSSGKRLASDQWLPKDLNLVKGVRHQDYGSSHHSAAIVFYDCAGSSGFELLKAIIDNNEAVAIYGLNQNQVLRNESRYNLDLNTDGFLG